MWQAPRSWQLARTAAIAAAVLAVACICVSGAGASARQPALSHESIGDCLKQLAARQSTLKYWQDLRTSVKRKAVYLLTLSSNPTIDLFIPVSAEEARELLAQQLLIGKITTSQLAASARELGRQTKDNLVLVEEFIRRSGTRVTEQKRQCDALRAGTATQATTTTEAEGGAATSLTLTFQGVTVATDLKSNVQSPGVRSGSATVHLQSGGTYDGTMSLNGALPAGYGTLVVTHPVPSNVVGSSAGKSGTFKDVTQPKGFGSTTYVAVNVCKSAAVSEANCLPAQAMIEIAWTP